MEGMEALVMVDDSGRDTFGRNYETEATLSIEDNLERKYSFTIH